MKSGNKIFPTPSRPSFAECGETQCHSVCQIRFVFKTKTIKDSQYYRYMQRPVFRNRSSLTSFLLFVPMVTTFIAIIPLQANFLHFSLRLMTHLVIESRAFFQNRLMFLLITNFIFFDYICCSEKFAFLSSSQILTFRRNVFSRIRKNWSCLLQMIFYIITFKIWFFWGSETSIDNLKSIIKKSKKTFAYMYSSSSYFPSVW